MIGRNTALAYFKGKPVDLKQIGRELNVRYLLEGSVQRGGNRMRVNVQLIDTKSGSHLWAERFDKPLADLFDMQDEIVARLAGALNVQLIAAEARRAEKASNSNSMDLYFEGMAWFNRGLTRDNLAQARICFDRAIIADRDNVDALIGSARTHVNEVAIGGANLRAAVLVAETQSARALSLVPDDARGHMTLGVVYIYTRRAAQGIAECEHALALDRNLAQAHANIGLSKNLIGRPEETETHIVEALRLSPRDTMASAWMFLAGNAKNQLGLWEQAAAWCQRAIEADRNFGNPYIGLGAALARLGRLDEARSAVRAGFALRPSLRALQSSAGLRGGAAGDNPTYKGGAGTASRRACEWQGSPNSDRDPPPRCLSPICTLSFGRISSFRKRARSANAP